MSRNIEFAPGEFYHIYNRGTEKRDIFLSDRDYERFLALLYTCNADNPVDLKLQGSTLYEILDVNRGQGMLNICAYALMPNHFHLLVRSNNDGDVSKFMQKISTGYTMYFNTRQERSGALFQGRFKARHANTDAYLAYLIAYIHLNPIKLIDADWKERGITDKNKAEDFLRKYRWSSYQDYLRVGRPEQAIISKNALPEYWNTPHSFDVFVTNWLEHESESIPTQTATLSEKSTAALV